MQGRGAAAASAYRNIPEVISLAGLSSASSGATRGARHRGGRARPGTG